MRVVLAIILLLPGVPFFTNAQDLTGQWTGSSMDKRSEIKQKIVLNLSSADSVIAGVLHWYYPETQDLRNFIIRGQFHSRDSTLSIREDSLEGSAEDNREDKGKGPYVLYYKHTGHKEILEGHWLISSGTPNSSGGQTELDIRLEKKLPPFIPLPPLHKEKDSAKLKLLTALNARQTPLVMAVPIPVKLDSIKVDLYDNGEIDGDSVSLYLNDELVISHLSLLAQPKTIWLHIDKSLPVNKLVLFAENLGKLPPNTALMEVTVKGKRYSIFLSTDYKRNAMVEFILQE